MGFQGQDFATAPAGYLIDPAFVPRVLPLLQAHGLKVQLGSSRPRNLPLLHFRETGRKVSPVAYQGVYTLELQGVWQTAATPKKLQLTWSPADLDRALYVSLDQPLCRLAFYLLDPRSTDSLVYWGAFHSALLREGMWGEPPRFPLLALGQPDAEPITTHPLPAPKAQE